MKRNKFLISTVLEKQDIPSDYCSKLGSEHWRLDRITWDLCAEDCSKSFKTKNHVTNHDSSISSVFQESTKVRTCHASFTTEFYEKAEQDDVLKST